MLDASPLIYNLSYNCICDFNEIANIKILDYYSHNRQQFVSDASRILQINGVHVYLRSNRISLVEGHYTACAVVKHVCDTLF